LLFKETASFSVPRGLGVWRKPAAGGTYRSDGGQFIFISGQPFRYNSNQLQANMEYILTNFFHESKTDVKTASNSKVVNNYTLEQNYPNPFNPSTTIEFALPKPAFITLKVYNLLGEEVTTLVADKLMAGRYKYDWDANGVASGVYLYRLQAGEFVQTRKLILMR